MFIPPGTTMYKKMPAPFPYFDIRLIMSYHMCWQQPASFIAYKMLTPFWLVLSPTVVTWSSQYTRTVLTCHIHWSLGHDSGRYIGFLWISLSGHHFLSRYFTTGSSDISTILMAKNLSPKNPHQEIYGSTRAHVQVAALNGQHNVETFIHHPQLSAGLKINEHHMWMA